MTYIPNKRYLAGELAKLVLGHVDDKSVPNLPFLENEVSRLLDNTIHEQPACEIKNSSILFSDLRGFTQISEKYSPQVLVDILNKYFSAMVEIIEANNGYIDKFIGDAILFVIAENNEKKPH